MSNLETIQIRSSNEPVSILKMRASPNDVTNGQVNLTKFPAFLSHSSEEIHEQFDRLQAHTIKLLTRPGSIVSASESAEHDCVKTSPTFAYHRIKLNKGRNSYINASPMLLPLPYDPAIVLEKEKAQYDTAERAKGLTIAASAPLDSGQFWRMLIQEKASIVLMLAPSAERDTWSWAQYFPLNTGEILRAGERLSIELLKKRTPMANVEIRELCVREDGCGEVLTLCHVVYTAWPSRSKLPVEHWQDILQLVDIFRKRTVIGRARIVHCRGGSRRTGTFIALEYLLREMEAGKLDGVEGGREVIFDTLKTMRQQRPRVIEQTEMVLLYHLLRVRWLEREARLLEE